jgi:hypothetical protein
MTDEKWEEIHSTISEYCDVDYGPYFDGNEITVVIRGIPSLNTMCGLKSAIGAVDIDIDVDFGSGCPTCGPTQEITMEITMPEEE